MSVAELWVELKAAVKADDESQRATASRQRKMPVRRRLCPALQNHMTLLNDLIKVRIQAATNMRAAYTRLIEALISPDESAFRESLKSKPGDRVGRLVFADWLEERADGRAEGYRALGSGRRSPGRCGWVDVDDRRYYIGPGAPLGVLPLDWCRITSRLCQSPTSQMTTIQHEDAAAVAFVMLGRVRRANILAKLTAAY